MHVMERSTQLNGHSCQANLMIYLIRKFMIDAFKIKNTKSTRHLTVDHALLMTHVIELADNLMCTYAAPCPESDRDRVR